jgi:hypothetical protein
MRMYELCDDGRMMLKAAVARRYHMRKLAAIEQREMHCKYKTKIKIDRENKRLIVTHESPKGFHMAGSGDFETYCSKIDGIIRKDYPASDWQVVQSMSVTDESAVDTAKPVVKKNYLDMAGENADQANVTTTPPPQKIPSAPAPAEQTIEPPPPAQIQERSRNVSF